MGGVECIGFNAREMKGSAITTLLGQLLLGAMFIGAALFKMYDADSFAVSVASFKVVPVSVINPIAVVLPAFELFCGVLIFVPMYRRSAALGMILLGLVFASLMVQGMFRGIHFDCGCFGKWDPIAGKPGLAIVRDLILVGVAIRLYRVFRGGSAYKEVSQTGPGDIARQTTLDEAVVTD